MKPLYILLAAEGHGPPPLVDIDATVFIQLGIFLLLLAALTKLVFRPYLALRQERDRNIEGARKESQHLSQDADEKLLTYEERVTKARKEAASTRASFRSEGEQQASAVLTEAHGKAEAKVEAARQNILRSTQAAQLSLRTRADQIAQAIATKILGREV